ncbi:hypothetical protein [Spirosoma sordidisoli]|uniref:Uncharacterized protein n=1 Tax=Spirosoma sordidisoli TaxID=2502893 RepID=A0A4Q2UJS8_9BACT|nr:hypothetical protein [Spirosoma sordidisoli]RYC69753.1 hypothetical protein EQG79_14250 [Spirosoma sordidisoli]
MITFSALEIIMTLTLVFGMLHARIREEAYNDLPDGEQVEVKRLVVADIVLILVIAFIGLQLVHVDTLPFTKPTSASGIFGFLALVIGNIDQFGQNMLKHKEDSIQHAIYLLGTHVLAVIVFTLATLLS